MPSQFLPAWVIWLLAIVGGILVIVLIILAIRYFCCAESVKPNGENVVIVDSSGTVISTTPKGKNESKKLGSNKFSGDLYIFLAD